MSMFKNLTIYTLPPGWIFDEDSARSAAAFVPCDSWSMESGGLLPVLDDRLIYPVGDQLALKFGIERRILPPAVIQRELDQRIADIEATGRFVGKRERAELKEAVISALLPRSFTVLSHIGVWINPEAGMLFIDTPSAAKAILVVDALEKSHPGLRARLLNSATKIGAGEAMGRWVSQGYEPAGFSVDSECSVDGPDGLSAAYRGFILDETAAADYVSHGMRVKRLAMTSRGVSFLLRDTGAITRIRWADIQRDEAESAQEQFEIDFALMAGTYQHIVDALVSEFGGIEGRE